MVKPEIYLEWTQDGTGIKAWLTTLTKHYTSLAASYHQQRMTDEAEMYLEIAERFKALQSNVNAMVDKVNQPE